MQFCVVCHSRGENTLRSTTQIYFCEFLRGSRCILHLFVLLLAGQSSHQPYSGTTQSFKHPLIPELPPALCPGVCRGLPDVPEAQLVTTSFKAWLHHDGKCALKFHGMSSTFTPHPTSFQGRKHDRGYVLLTFNGALVKGEAPSSTFAVTRVS